MLLVPNCDNIYPCPNSVTLKCTVIIQRKVLIAVFRNVLKKFDYKKHWPFIPGFLLLCIILIHPGHKWQDATCTEAQTCSICRATEGEPLGHTWQSATCNAPRTCSVCGIITGTTLRHNWKDATCIELKTCRLCGLQEGSISGHSYLPATCTEPEICSVCGRVAPWYSYPNGHEWIAATCTTPKTCSVCSEQEGDLVPHTFSDWKITLEATCQSEGEQSKTCSYCDETLTESIPTKGHEAGNWETIKNPTSYSPGIQVRYCTVCGKTVEEREYTRPVNQGYGGGGSNSGGNGNNFNKYNNTSQQNTSATYVLNTSTMKFHYPSCRYVPKISPRNYATSTQSRGALTSQGYSSCGHCHP